MLPDNADGIDEGREDDNAKQAGGRKVRRKVVFFTSTCLP
jgi:hypothetical protein